MATTTAPTAAYEALQKAARDSAAARKAKFAQMSPEDQAGALRLLQEQLAANQRANRPKSWLALRGIDSQAMVARANQKQGR